MATREPLSVAVITLNEEQNLDRCLESVTWADELIVVDSGSTDGTIRIAERHGARVLCEPWRGYVAQKNLSLDSATHTWVLSLDADEWLTEAGAAEVRRALEAPQLDAWAINRRTAFCGAFLRHVWSRDWQVRLFRKDRGRFAGGRVHESVRLTSGSRVGRLRHRLQHLAYRSMHDYVERMNRYTDLAAETLVERGRTAGIMRLLFSPPATFLRCYLLRLGILDGTRGLLVSAGSAYYVLLKYAKLWEASRTETDRGQT